LFDFKMKNDLASSKEGDEFPRRLSDPLPPMILFYHVSLQPNSGNRGDRVYVGMCHPWLDILVFSDKDDKA